MGCFTLLFIAILTVSTVTSLLCSDRRPLGSASGDDVPRLTTLQYCFIDDCTIMRTDTGEKLDITYTTDDSLIIATPTDGHTSVVIARLDDELPCVASTTEAIEPILVVLIVLSVILVPTLTVIVNGYIFIVHLMFKELRTTFGKLLMLYCLLIICLSVSFDAKAILTSSQIGKQLVACHLSTISMMIFAVGSDVSATCILHCFAYILYRSNKLQHISKEESKSWSRFYFGCILSVVSLVSFL